MRQDRLSPLQADSSCLTDMKRVLSIILAVLSLALLFSSCASAESKLYGAWYNDTNGIRNAIQFSENEKGKDCFIWAIYDIENDEIKSTARGYYTITGSTFTLEYLDTDSEYNLTYSLSDGVLTLKDGNTSIVFTKYVE